MARLALRYRRKATLPTPVRGACVDAARRPWAGLRASRRRGSLRTIGRRSGGDAAEGGLGEGSAYGRGRGPGLLRERRRSGRRLLRDWRRRQLDLQLGRPVRLRPRAHESRAAQPGLHLPVIRLHNLRIDLELDPEHRLGEIGLGLDGLGRDLRVGRDKAHRCGNDIVRSRVQDEAGFVPHCKIARVGGAKKHVM